MGSEESNLNNKINQVLQNKGVLILIKYVIYEIMWKDALLDMVCSKLSSRHIAFDFDAMLL
jgi:hypothetical protein